MSAIRTFSILVGAFRYLCTLEVINFEVVFSMNTLKNHASTEIVKTRLVGTTPLKDHTVRIHGTPYSGALKDLTKGF